MNRERIRAHLIKEEGLNLERHKVDGKEHIGYGFNLEDEWDDDLLDYLGFQDEDEIGSITQEQADYILDWWIDSITATISKRFGEKFTKLSPLRQENLFSMRYQMGPAGLRAFRMMWDAIENDDFVEASNQMLDSLWAKEQSPERAGRISKTFRLDEERHLEIPGYPDLEVDLQDLAVLGDSVLSVFTNQELIEELSRRLADKSEVGKGA